MDKSQRLLAARYAQAFLDVVYDQLQPASIGGLEKAAAFFSCHQQACFLMDLSLLSAESKQEALKKYVDRYLLPPVTEKLLALLVTHKHSGLIGAVLSQCVALYKKRARIMTFTVESSLELSHEEKATIENFLKEQVSMVVVCSYFIVPSLIAGIRIHNENYRWEYSVHAQLRALYTSVKR